MKINRVVLGIFLLCFFSIAIVPVVHGASTPPYSPDERFGLATGCADAAALSVPWMQGWGHGSNYANQGEESCINRGLKAFYTLGKLDNYEKYTNGGIYTILSLENKFLSDPTTTDDEKGWYNDVRTVLHNQNAYHAEGACEGADPSDLGKNGCYDNAKSSFLLIKYKYTNSNPSSTTSIEGGGQKGLAYAITNEPDLGPQMSPAEYGIYYHAFYQMIKKYDSTAQIMVGGVSGGYRSSRATSNNPNQWVFDFIDAYKSKYGGQQPPVDIWGVHIYDYPWTKVRDMAIWFRDLLDRNGYMGVPIWLTEMSYLGGDGSISGVTINKGPYYDFRLPNESTASAIVRIREGLLTIPQRETQDAMMVNDYMIPLINWFKGDGKNVIAKWFWFAPHFADIRTSIETATTSTYFGHEKLVVEKADNIVAMYKRIGSPEYNPLGVTYTQLINIPVLVNKGFETSTVTPYGYWFWPATPQAKAGIDTTEKNTGNQSIKISVGSVAGPNGFTAAIVQTVNSSAFGGKYVQFSVSCKTADGAKAFIKIDVTNAAGVRNSWWMPGVSSQTECPAWKQIKTDIVQIPLGTIKLDLNVLPVGQNAVVWFDDFNIDVKECSHKFEGDANCDDRVEYATDFPIIANEITQQIDISTKADFNGDNKVTLQDFEILRKKLFPN